MYDTPPLPPPPYYGLFLQSLLYNPNKPIILDSIFYAPTFSQIIFDHAEINNTKFEKKDNKGVTITSCEFKNTKIQNSTFIKTRISDCSFTRTSTTWILHKSAVWQPCSPTSPAGCTRATTLQSLTGPVQDPKIYKGRIDGDSYYSM